MFEENTPSDKPTMPQILASVRRIISREEDALHVPTPTNDEEEFAVTRNAPEAAEQTAPAPVQQEVEAVADPDNTHDDEFVRINNFLQSYPQQDLNPQFANALKETAQNAVTHVGENLQSVLPQAASPLVENAMVLTKQVLQDGTVLDHANAAMQKVVHAVSPMPVTAPTFSEPAATLRQQFDTGLSTHETTATDGFLELLVLRALQPMLREWIDTKLPDIAERLVREQLRR